MGPEDIEGRDFFVGLRGYDRDEVHQFLREVAAEHRAVLSELEMLRTRQPTADPFEHLGANVAAILRSANETAAMITSTANEDADQIRARAEAAAEQVRRDADEYAGRVRDEVASETETSRHFIEAARDQADVLRQEGERRASELIAEAEARIPAIEAAAEEAGRARAGAAVDHLVARLTDATRQQEALRARLTEASDEIQLALMALGDPVTDPAKVLDDAARSVIVLEDTVASE